MFEVNAHVTEAELFAAIQPMIIKGLMVHFGGRDEIFTRVKLNNNTSSDVIECLKHIQRSKMFVVVYMARYMAEGDEVASEVLAGLSAKRSGDGFVVVNNNVLETFEWLN
jgi:hypothetical protein